MAGLGSNHFTITTHANFIPELWALDIIEAVEKNLVLANLVKRFDEVAAAGGDTIHIPHVSNFNAVQKASNTAVTPQATTEGKTDISLDQHYHVAFVVEDMAKVQAYRDLRSIYTEKAGYAIAKKIDDDLAGLYSGLSQASAVGGAISWAELIDLRETLSLAEAPMTDRFLVVNSYAVTDMLNLSEIKSRDFVGQEGQMPSVTGLIAKNVMGFGVYESNNIVTTGPVSATYTDHNLAFHKDAFGCAVQLGPRVQSDYQLDYLGTLVVVDVLYGFKELRDTFAIDVQRTRS